MQDSSTFSETNVITTLLVGVPGSGKTCVAMGFPRPYFLSTDHKLGNAIKRYPGKKFLYDYPDVVNGKEVPMTMRWSQVGNLVVEASKQLDKFDTIVADNLTDIGDYLQAYICSQPAMSKAGRPKAAGEAIMEQSDWQAYYVLMGRFLSNLKLLGKNVVVCAHEAVDKDEVTGTLTYYPLVGGKWKTSLASQFNNVWQCKATQTGQNEHRYFVTTRPTPRMMCINSLDLPTEFDFSWDELARRMGNTSIAK